MRPSAVLRARGGRLHRWCIARRHALAVVACLLSAREARAQAPAWVEVERRVLLTDGRTAAEVKAIALQEALAEAVRRVAGVRISGTQSAVTGDSAGTRIDRFEQAVRLDVSGRATRWETVREEWRSARSGESAPPMLVLTMRKRRCLTHSKALQRSQTLMTRKMTTRWTK